MFGDIDTPIAVALIGLGATLAAAAVSFALSRWSETTARRREGYADAMRELVAWSEFPYRIRRRTSDASDELTRLAEVGHTHQECLRYRETWVRAENRWVGQVFHEVIEDMGALLGPACVEAWAAPPITRAADMNLAGWGPHGTKEPLERLERAIEFRFGWRRFAAIAGWRPDAKPRIAETSELPVPVPVAEQSGSSP